MRLRERDLKTLYLFQPKPVTGHAGGHKNTYNEPYCTFKGNVQPFTEDSYNNIDGIAVTNQYVILTADTINVKETCGIGYSEDKPDFIVKTIQHWTNYKKIVVEVVK